MVVPSTTKEELKLRLENSNGHPKPTVIDVRLKHPYECSAVSLPGARRVPPSAVGTTEFPPDRDIVAYDSDRDAYTSSAIVAQLLKRGYRAFVLEGGIAAWVAAGYPTEAKDAPGRMSPEPAAARI